MAKLALLLFLACWASASALGANRVVCYLDGNAFRRPEPHRLLVSEIEPSLSYCTHLIYGYARIDTDSYKAVVRHEGEGANYTSVMALKRRFPALNILLSIGGGSADSGQREKYLHLLESELSTMARIGVFFLLGLLASSHAYEYKDALWKSLLFYQAQRSGKLSGMDSSLYWRGDSALNDRGQNGEDLTGGYYDAGDFVKFGFPLAFTMTVLSWGVLDWGEGYSTAGVLGEAHNCIRWGMDYLIKAHVSDNELYVQVGDGDADHAYWGRPEDMTMARPSYKVTTSAPGSDVAAETAAAFAAASLVFKGVDDAYSGTLLSHAKSLFNFADSYRGVYSDSVPAAANFYRSNGYADELPWAAVWLYRATNDQSYLSKAISLYNEGALQSRTGFGWDEKSAGATVLLAKLTNDQAYKSTIQGYCDYMLNSQQRTPKGLLFLGEWGSLRIMADAMFICMMASDLGINQAAYRSLVKQQMGYALGDTGFSYVVGVGSSYPTHAHHRSSSCPDPPATCDWNTYNGGQPNAHVLNGALVGGPGANDDYVDTRQDSQKNEVALDYNAPYQGLLAALIKYNL